MIEMNKYYTAKDIEELAAKGVQQLELSPGDFLTDFARETAQQFDITLVNGGRQIPASTLPTSLSNTNIMRNKYNKPTGCQHNSSSLPTTQSQIAVSSSSAKQGASSNTVNKLVDLMGKVIKRGG